MACSVLTSCLGQWSPIAGTILAALGSLYILWSTGDDHVPTAKPVHHDANSGSSRPSRSTERQPSPRPPSSVHCNPNGILENGLGIRSESPNVTELIPTLTHPGSERLHANPASHDDQQDHHQPDQPTAGRNVVRRWLTSAGNYLGDAAHEKLDPDHVRNDEDTHRFPEVPGEILRNPDLERISRTYSKLREERENSIYAASIVSSPGLEGSSSPPPMQHTPRPDISPVRRPERRATLEVPKEAHRRSESH